MKSTRKIFMATLLSLPLAATAQVKITDTVRAGESSVFTRSETFQRYITRGNFCSLILDNLLFSETLAGSFMLDLSMKFNTDNNQNTNTLRVLFDDLIVVSEVGKPMALGLSGDWLAKKLTLSNVTNIEIQIRLIPVVDNKFNEAYALLKPILSKPIYGLPSALDLGGVFDKFAAIASAGDQRTPLLFSATIPVPQNIVEAQLIEKQATRPPLRNNDTIGITMSGSKEVTDPSLTGKAKDFLNGISSFATGRTLIPRSSSSFRGMVSLRFTKDFTQPLSDSLISQLKDLSDTAEQAYTADALGQVGTKASDTIKMIEGAAKSKDIDGRAEFHLRSYVDMARVWALYKRATVDGSEAIKTSQWRILFRNWHSKVNIQGPAHYTQAYAISEIYPSNRLAKIFVPYSLSDEMTLEVLQRQTIIHQTLADLGDTASAERP